MGKFEEMKIALKCEEKLYKHYYEKIAHILIKTNHFCSDYDEMK
jgi:hypothetical protein